jgi:hypothetical protein
MVRENRTFDKGLKMTTRRVLISLGIFIACIAWSGAGASGARDFAADATYLFFVKGELAGKSEVKAELSNGTLVLESTTETQIGEGWMSLKNRTEYERKTLRPRLYRYEGSRAGESMSGTIRFQPDSIRAELEVGGTDMTAKVAWTDGTVIFQNYVPEHLLVMARELADSNRAFRRFRVLFPADMMTAQGFGSAETEFELPIRPPVVCMVYTVSLETSPPFFLYYDREGKALVYIDFPSTETEVFLQSVFGDQPKSKYSPPPAPEGGQ